MSANIPFSDSEIATLIENGWEADDCVFTKIRLTLLSCGCCSSTDNLLLSKSENGLYLVSYWPHGGVDENHHTASLNEAINWF